MICHSPFWDNDLSQCCACDCDEELTGGEEDEGSQQHPRISWHVGNYLLTSILPVSGLGTAFRHWEATHRDIQLWPLSCG